MSRSKHVTTGVTEEELNYGIIQREKTTRVSSSLPVKPVTLLEGV